MASVIWKWQGPLTYVRPRVTRGSAAGSSLADAYADNHVMAGYDGAGNPVGICGIAIDAFPKMSEKLGDEHLCPRCAAKQVGL